MRKKIIFLFLLVGAVVFCGAFNVQALTITTSAYETMNGSDYGFIFSITDDGTAPGKFAAELFNDSDDALIDLLAFNMDATLGTDFTIEPISPNWTFTATAQQISFDYIGDADGQADRINPGAALTFVFDFDSTFLDSLSDPFTVWTGTSQSDGGGIGGGDDFGQVAVSFQGIGGGTFSNDSDLLASNYQVAPVPEPATIMLLGVGLISIAGLGRKRILK